MKPIPGSGIAKIIMKKKPQRLSVEELKKFSGFENITNEQAKDLLYMVDRFCKIILELK